MRSAAECVGRRMHCWCDRRTHSESPTQNALVGRSSRLNLHRLTRHRQDRLVVSGGRCELGITRIALWVEADARCDKVDCMAKLVGLTSTVARNDDRCSVLSITELRPTTVAHLAH